MKKLLIPHIRAQVFLLASLLSVGPAFAATQSLTILGGSGTVGNVDSYAEASRDGGATWQPAYLTGWHPWGFIPGTNSWINFDPSPFVGLNSTTIYRIRFTAPASWTGSPQMNIQISADNRADVTFNSTYIGRIEGVGQLNANALFAQALQPGVNTLYLTLTDWGGWVGFNYRIDMSVEADDDFVLGEAGDSDVDGLTDTEEGAIGTDPNNPDTDGDGVNDGDEVAAGTNPIAPPDLDADDDGLTDSQEAELGTNPDNPDTDNDGLTDSQEVALGTNPLSADTDGDGVSDGAENTAGTNPLVADTDGDGLSDGAEASRGTNPLVTDSDGDGLTDGSEVANGTNPLSADTDGDGVGDAFDHQNLAITGSIVIFGVNSGIPNRVDANGVDIGSQIAGELATCAAEARNHGAFVSCVAHCLEGYVAAGLITSAEKDILQSIAGRSNVGKPAASGNGKAKGKG